MKYTTYSIINKTPLLENFNKLFNDCSAHMRNIRNIASIFTKMALFLVLSFNWSQLATAQTTVDLSSYLNEATVTSSDDQFEEVTDNNNSSVAVYPQARLNIVKVLVNDDGGTAEIDAFTILAANKTPNFENAPIASGDTNTYVADVMHLTVNTTTLSTEFSLSESETDGYEIQGWSCSGNGTADVASGQRTGTITLGVAESATCTITNNDISPKIRLAKEVINDDGGTASYNDFNLSVGDKEFVLEASEASADGTLYLSKFIEVPANTNLDLVESSLTGYSNGTWNCTAGTLSDDSYDEGVINLESGAEVTCTITNNDIAPQITLVKVVVNDNGGNKVVSDFELKVGNTAFVTATQETAGENSTRYISEVIEVKANEAFNLSEKNDVAGYITGSWNCTSGSLGSGSEGSGTATITLTVGQNTTCTITNDDKGVDLAITKTVSNSTPEIGEEITFTLVIGNSGEHTATNVSVVDNLPAGFTYVSDTLPLGVTVDPGQDLGWFIDEIDPDQTVTIMFKATVGAP